MITQAGRYKAYCVNSVVYESDKKNLILCLEFELADPPNERIKFRQVIARADGTIMTKGIDALRRAYAAWDGTDPFWFTEYDLREIDVDLVVEMEPGLNDPSRYYPRVKWVNPPGGRDEDVVPADRAAIMAKYGAKLRAAAGAPSAQKGPPKAAPVQVKAAPAPAPAAPAPAPAAPKALSAPPKAPTPPAPPKKAETPPPAEATQNSAWDLCLQLTPDFTDKAREELWFAACDSTGKTQDAMGAADWAAVEDYLRADASKGIEANPLPF